MPNKSPKVKVQKYKIINQLVRLIESILFTLFLMFELCMSFRNNVLNVVNATC